MSHLVINPTAGSPSAFALAASSSSVLEEDYDYAARWQYGDDSVADLAKQVALWIAVPVDKKKKNKKVKAPRSQATELFPFEVPAVPAAPSAMSPSATSQTMAQRVRALAWALGLLLRSKLRKELKKVILPVGACFGMGLVLLYLVEAFSRFSAAPLQLQ